MDESAMMKEQFQQWILAQSNERIKITLEDENHIELISKSAKGAVNFFSLNIIELDVKKLDDEPVFYLHFQLNTLEHAKELFSELYDCMLKVKEEDMHQVLFCCSAGLTTGYFAERMNEGFELLNLKYHVDAIMYTNLEKVQDQYELICIAPQITYIMPTLQRQFPHANIIKIPPNIFARYDVGEMVKLIQNTVDQPVNYNITKPHSYRNIASHAHPILCLNIIRNSRRTHIVYSVYDGHNYVVFNNEVIKPKIYLSDIYDAIDITLAAYPDIDCIGLSLPGIINKDRFISANYVEGLNDHNLDELFTNKYHKKFIFTNDANAAAVGFYSSHNQYESLSFIYQPLYYRAGIGSVVNGKLITGAHNLAGEVKLIPMEYSKPFYDLLKEKDGGIEIITKQIIALITTIDPEAIVICSQLIDDVDVIRKELLKYLEHEHYLPDLILEENFHIYLFLGQLILCVQALEK